MRMESRMNELSTLPDLSWPQAFVIAVVAMCCAWIIVVFFREITK